MKPRRDAAEGDPLRRAPAEPSSMNLLTKVVLLLVLLVVAGFVLLHVLPWLLGLLALLGAFKLYQAFKNRPPPPPFRWP